MAQQVKVLTVKSNDLSSTSGIQVVEERTDPYKLTSDYHTCALAGTHTHGGGWLQVNKNIVLKSILLHMLI